MTQPTSLQQATDIAHAIEQATSSVLVGQQQIVRDVLVALISHGITYCVAVEAKLGSREAKLVDVIFAMSLAKLSAYLFAQGREQGVGLAVTPRLPSLASTATQYVMPC